MKNKIFLCLLSLAFAFISLPTFAQDADVADPETSTAAPTKKIDLKKVKKEQAPQVQVVQNRLFKKIGRVRLGAFAGVVSTDPFLSVMMYGGKVAYSFTDLFGIQAFYWKDNAKESASEKAFRAQTGFQTNANKPKSFYGVEGLWTPIYGKLNVLNSSIVYFDFRMGLGVGQRATESGTSLAYVGNVGGDVFLNQNIVLDFEFRMFGFKQKILEKVAAATIGQTVATPFELSSSFSVGLGYLF